MFVVGGQSEQDCALRRSHPHPNLLPSREKGCVGFSSSLIPSGYPGWAHLDSRFRGNDGGTWEQWTRRFQFKPDFGWLAWLGASGFPPPFPQGRRSFAGMAGMAESAEAAKSVQIRQTRPDVWTRAEKTNAPPALGGAMRWREREGVEPTAPTAGLPPDGFEDRESHQALSAPVSGIRAPPAPHCPPRACPKRSAGDVGGDG